MHPAPQKTRDDVVRQLAVASVSGTLVLFVGSGFSKALTAGAAPTWGQLLQRVAKRVGLADPLDDPSTIVGVSFPQLANKMAASLARSVAAEERFQASSAEDHYAEAVRRIKEAASRETASVEPDAKVLERFKAAFGKLAPVAVVTTNYDFLIEACLDHAEMLLPNQVFRSRRDCVPVLHLHGSLRHPESIVLLEGDYVQALDAREYRHVRLGVLFAENTTLMLGYALGDLNVRTALAAAAAYRNPSAELRSNDVGQVVVLNRTECPSDSARHGRNGEWVIEEAEIVTLLEAIAEQREKVHKSWTACRTR